MYLWRKNGRYLDGRLHDDLPKLMVESLLWDHWPPEEGED